MLESLISKLREVQDSLVSSNGSRREGDLLDTDVRRAVDGLEGLDGSREGHDS